MTQSLITPLSLLMIFAFLPISAKGQKLKVMTYNIRYNNPNDGENAWDNRKAFLLNQIFYNDPDIFGIQEGLEGQVAYLDKNLPAYNYLGVGRDDGKKKGEFSAIFYKQGKFKLLEEGTFWLSPTPGKPSKAWDAALERICTYALFKGKKGKKFWVFNTHFDHRGVQARLESTKVIHQKIKELNTKDYPVVIMGDLNALPDSEPIKFLNEHYKDAYQISALPPFGPFGTFNGFSWESEIKNRIDYIFVSEKIKVIHQATLSDSKEKRYPSDHFPVIAKIFL